MSDQTIIDIDLLLEEEQVAPPAVLRIRGRDIEIPPTAPSGVVSALAQIQLGKRRGLEQMVDDGTAALIQSILDATRNDPDVAALDAKILIRAAMAAWSLGKAPSSASEPSNTPEPSSPQTSAGSTAST